MNWSEIIAWSGVVVVWCSVGFSIYMHVKSGRRWKAMFAELQQDHADALRILERLAEEKERVQAMTFANVALRQHLVAECARRGIPFPPDASDKPVLH